MSFIHTNSLRARYKETQLISLVYNFVNAFDRVIYTLHVFHTGQLAYAHTNKEQE